MQRRVAIRIGAVLLIALTGGLALAIASAPTPESRQRARAEAIARWQAREFSAYRILIEEGNCTTDYVVRDERVAWAFEAPCGRGQARSITNLFAMIDQGPSPRACVGPSCACRWVTTVDVDYDRVLGYPRTIVIRTTAWPNWLGGAYWSDLASSRANPCSAMSERVVRVKSLTPSARAGG
jgi:hypothetical protein